MNFTDIKLETYCIESSMEIPAYLLDLERETNLKTTMPQMLSGRLQGRLLSFISKIVKPVNILEIGTFTGYSALCLAEGIDKDGKLITIEANDEYNWLIDKYFKISPYFNKIDFRFGDALKIIESLDLEFDLVFIDAHKNDYLQYYKSIINKIRSGGIIIVDNVLWNGKVIFELGDKTAELLNNFNSYIKKDVRVEQIMLPIRDGLTLILKK